MPLTFQILPIPIGGAGLDSRTDAKVIPAPALAAAENVTFATPGRLTKRTGFKVPGSATTADAVAAVGDALFRLNRAGASVYDSLNDTFASVSGPTSMGVEYLFDTSNALYPFAFDSCRAGSRDYLISSSWLTGASTEKAQVFSRSTTDGSIVTSITTSSNVRSPKVVAINSTAYFFYVSGTNLLFATSTTGTIGASETTVVSDVHATLKMFDIAVTGSQILLAYVNTAGDIKSGYVSTSGVLGSTNTNTPAATITCLGVAAVSGGNYGIMWAMNSVQDVVARLYNSAGTAYAAVQTIDSATGNNINRVVGCFDTAGTTLSVFYEVYAAAVVNRLVKRGTLNTAASVGAGAVFYRHSLILSKPWLIAAAGSDQTYIVVGHNVDTASAGGIQSGAVIVKYNAGTSAGQVIGGLLPNEAYGFAGATDPAINVFGEDGHTPSAHLYAAGAVLVPLWIRHETASGTLDNASVRLVSLTLNHAEAFASVGVAGQLYVAGAQLEILAPRAATSGVSTIGNCEAAPLFYPEKITLTPSNSTGSMTSLGTYSYRFYWEMYDGNGAIIRSTYAGNQLVTLGAADDTVTATVPTLAHTNCNTTNRLMWLGVYRSQASGSIHYRVSKYPSSPYGGTNGFVINDPTADTISFVDGLSDATIITREIDYQSSDPVELDNIAPPPHKVIAAGNNRVFLSGMEDPNLIWVSKTRATGEALHFNDALTISVDAGDGPITGLATWQDNLIIFREHQIYIVGGDGPDNFGLGGEFTPCRIISEDVGCIEQRSIVRIPSGIMFKSKKGYYITDGQSLNYIGAMVERYNSEAVTSAVALTANHEVRITTASRTLVFDYLAGQWATWTLPATHACLWQDSWVALDGTSIMLPTPTLYVDRAGAGYTMAVETGWIRTSALQGFMRVRRILFLGSTKGTHSPTIKIAYDYEESAENTPVWTDTFTWDPASIGNTAYQYQVRVSRGRCQSIKIRVEDGAATTAAFTLSEIALEVGLKQGPMKLGAGKQA